MKKRIKADKVSVVVAIATLTVVAAVALASPAFFPLASVKAIALSH